MNVTMDRQKRLAMHRRIVRRHPRLFPLWVGPLLGPFHALTASRPYAVLKGSGLLKRLC
jgi:hypothetical protein